MDAKNRVTVPSRWLTGEEEEFYSVVDPQSQFLMIMPAEEFANVEKSVNERTDIAPADKRRFIRHFYGTSHTVSADKQGRILLPVEHCQRAGLKENVVLVGSKNRFELWSSDRWTAAKPAETDSYQKVADLIGL